MDSEILSGSAGKNFSQTISFPGNDSKYSVTIVAEDVKVTCSAGNHNHGSSKVKLTNVVDYNWEHKYYTGHLLAVHIAGKFFAYGIKGKGGGMVRVANTETSSRALIKDLSSEVQDLAFAHIYATVILGCVDETGNLYVHKCEEKADGTVCNLLLHIVKPENLVSSVHRVIWCPFIPDEDCEDYEDNSTLLVLTHGDKAQLLNVNVINNKYGYGHLSLSDMSEGYLEINEHSQPIMDAAFSPDGTAVATASQDGYVKFFQIYMHEGKSPRCLHEWQPHDGKPLSYLDFLDNHSFYTPDEQFWKFAITGCENNTELKIWSCRSWACLQTITFNPHPSSSIKEGYFKVRLDSTSSYLLLSEINSRILYILEITKSNKDTDESKAYARNISEFLLPSPFLSFGILEASLRNFRTDSTTDDLYPCDENDDFDEQIVATVIRMYVVQPKRLQECQIAYQTDSSVNKMYQETTDVLNDEENNENIEKLTQILQNDLPKQFNDFQMLMQPTQPLNLMTPDAFSSPVKNDERKESPIIENSDIPSSTTIETSNFPRKEYASGGSSPSREVQEILSLNNSYSAHIYEEEKKEDTNGYENNFNENITNLEWPVAPIIKAKDVIKEEQRNLELSAGDNIVNHKDNVAMLQELIVALMSTVREQNSQLNTLQQEIKNLKMTQDKLQIPENLENVIEKQLELALARSNAQQAKIFEHWANARAAKDREFQESVVQNISHIMDQEVCEKLQSTINSEMKTAVLPVIGATFENLKHVLQEDFHQRLSNLDQMIKDSLTKLLISKPVVESLSNNLIPVIRPNIEKCFREVVSNDLIPAFEKACSNMFVQIHETFHQGTKEYTASVESYMEKQRKQQEKNKELVTQISNLSEIMTQCTEKLSTTVHAELQKQLVASFVSMQDKLTSNITDIVKEQIGIAFRNHAASLEDSVVNAVRSRAVTPLPHVVDTQTILAQIQTMIQQGHLNQAFQTALSASELSLVVYICERLNPQVVFGGSPCQIQQHVLLSLIQQLSADMTNHTELKHRYLEEAVLNLDPSNPVTKEHMSTVLKDLYRQLSHYINNNPNGKVVRNMKMLQMATQSLLKH